MSFIQKFLLIMLHKISGKNVLFHACCCFFIYRKDSVCNAVFIRPIKSDCKVNQAKQRVKNLVDSTRERLYF